MNLLDDIHACTYGTQSPMADATEYKKDDHVCVLSPKRQTKVGCRRLILGRDTVVVTRTLVPEGSHWRRSWQHYPRTKMSDWRLSGTVEPTAT